MYKLYKDPISNETVGVFNSDTNTSFLLGGNSTEEQEYLKWLAEGNTPEPADGA